VLSRTVTNCQPRTIQTYLYHIRRFIVYVNKPLIEVTKADVELWLLSLKEKDRSPAYLRMVHRNLSIFFNWMVAEEMIPRSPMRNMPRPRVPRRVRIVRQAFIRLPARPPPAGPPPGPAIPALPSASHVCSLHFVLLPFPLAVSAPQRGKTKAGKQCPLHLWSASPLFS